MQIHYDFFRVENDNMTPARGRILISEPLLNDSYFKRSVVLLTEHSENGSVGFVLNKPIDISITEVIEDFPSFDTTLYVGGPVGKDTVHYIHTLGELIPNSVQVKDGIYWGGDFEQVKEYIREGLIQPSQIRFFLGYSGWNPQQLEGEIENNAWLVSEVDGSKIMKPDENMWEKILRSLGSHYKSWTNCPENPTLN
ncbi:MAG: YqgE/AlgH family protein [Bacteroidales bacterium]|nr:YqgE/AlgH family protein [Bacteroidales bacterium]MBS3774026.1 YqgE/AlgH family protein [Bacteroidales bacterium]